MPFPQRRRFLLQSKAAALPSPNHLLDDEFTTAVSAGALNNTAAEPGPGTRTVIDANYKITTGNDVLSFASGAAANDGIWYAAITRQSGQVVVATIIPSDTNGILNVGWDSNASGAINDSLRFDASGVIKVVPNGGTAISVGAYTATSYQVAIVMRAGGILWLIKGGTFTAWTLLWIGNAGIKTGQASINAGNTTSVFTADYIRAPIDLWLPTPLASDGFVSTFGTSDGLGHEEGYYYLLYDKFTTTVAAGSLNNTAAEPGPGTRTVTDTNTKISIAGEVLSFATGAAANDGLWYAAITRQSGQVLVATVIPSNTNGILNVGWDSNASGAINDSLRFDAGGVIKVVPNGGTAISVGAYTATSYQVAIIMRAGGILWLIKGGTFTKWTLLWIGNAGIKTGQAAINAGNTTSVFTADSIRASNTLWLPTPLVSDGFASSFATSDGLGHEEGYY